MSFHNADEVGLLMKDPDQLATSLTKLSDLFPGQNVGELIMEDVKYAQQSTIEALPEVRVTPQRGALCCHTRHAMDGVHACCHNGMRLRLQAYCTFYPQVPCFPDWPTDHQLACASGRAIPRWTNYKCGAEN